MTTDCPFCGDDQFEKASRKCRKCGTVFNEFPKPKPLPPRVPYEFTMRGSHTSNRQYYGSDEQ